MGIPLPKVSGTLSDATKLGWDDQDQTVSKLIYLPVITDNFANLSAWTETDADAKVNLSGGVVTMDGGSAWNTHGILYTGGITLAEGYFEVKVSYDGATDTAFTFTISLNNANALPNGPVAGASISAPTATTFNYGPWFPGSDSLTRCAVVHGTFYTIRHYVLKSKAGVTYNRFKITIQGGIYTTETIVYDSDISFQTWTTPVYYSLSRYASAPTRKCNFKEFRWYSGYATDGPTTEFVHDAGASMVFNNFDCTALAMPGTVPSTNLKFAYSFDDGVASYSAYLTLAQLNAVGKISENHRYIRIKVQNNSDGATLVYGAKPESATATDGVISATAFTDAAITTQITNATTGVITITGTNLDKVNSASLVGVSTVGYTITAQTATSLELTPT